MNYPSEVNARKNFPIVDSGFIPETGYSWVTIDTNYGRFTGTARVHPLDMEAGNFNTLFGQNIAHTRAYIEYLKFYKQMLLFAHKGLLSLWAQAPKKNGAATHMRIQLNQYEFEIQDCRQTITDLKNSITARLDTAEKYYKMMQARNK